MLIVDANSPTLFKDGDLLIVTPHAVRAIIEVKTKLTGPKATSKALSKIADNARLCCGTEVGSRLWTGLFVYEGCSDEDLHKNLLKSVKAAWEEPKMPVKAITWGRGTFVRFWGEGKNTWRSYDLHDLAPSYFLGNLLLSLAGWSVRNAGYAWFPLRDGKEQRRRFEIGFHDDEPKPC